MAIAMPSPTSSVAIATRCALRPPSTSPTSTPAKGTSTDSTSSKPPGVVRSMAVETGT